MHAHTHTHTHMHAHKRMYAHTPVLSCLIAAIETVMQAKKWQLE